MKRRSFLKFLAAGAVIATTGIGSLKKKEKYVDVPEFELTSNPTISTEVKERCFKVIEEKYELAIEQIWKHEDELMFRQMKKAA